MSALARATALALGLACLAAAETPAAFDPPFAFPALGHEKGGAPPTEAKFGRACFGFVYGLVKEKPADLPKEMMKSCVQQDKKGCNRLAQQLQKIVQAKEAEGPSDAGHEHAAKKEQTSKAGKLQAPSGKKTEAASAAPEVPHAAPVAPAAKKVQSVAAKAHKARKPGARVKFEDRDKEESFLQVGAEAHNAPLAFGNAFDEDFANFGIDPNAAVAAPSGANGDAPSVSLAQDYAAFGADAQEEKAQVAAHEAHKKTSLVAEQHPKKIGLVAEQHPKRYGDWCSNLWAAATSTYDPAKVKAAEKASEQKPAAAEKKDGEKKVEAEKAPEKKPAAEKKDGEKKVEAEKAPEKKPAAAKKDGEKKVEAEKPATKALRATAKKA